jgi:hypothetical protein
LMISSLSRSSKSTVSSLSSASTSPSSASTHRSSSGRKPLIVTHEAPFTFGHNPQYTSDGYASDRPTSTLQALPEGREVEIGKAISTDYQQRQMRASSTASEASSGLTPIFCFETPDTDPKQRGPLGMLGAPGRQPLLFRPLVLIVILRNLMLTSRFRTHILSMRTAHVPQCAL